MSEKISIIIVHHEEPEYLNILLQSIKICSVNNDYEIIVVDNDSNSNESLKYLEQIEIKENITVIRNTQNESYSKSLFLGLNGVSNDSEYLIFSHSDNVVLNKSWLDFLIGQEIDNQKFGALCLGPLMDYTGPGRQMKQGPYYNFLFTKKSIFNNLNQFAAKECNNVGLFLGYQLQLQEIGKETIMADPRGFMNHYACKKVSQEEKIADIDKFNVFFAERMKKYNKAMK
jgi:glycosyltransferase involved in cell wall biosynthesis